MSENPEPLAEDPITADRVMPLLLELAESTAPWVAGLHYEYLPDCVSTNALLKEIAESGNAGMAGKAGMAGTTGMSGTTIATDAQTGGRGRLGRTWVSEAGRDLTFSVLIRPSLLPAQGHLLSLAACVAVAEVLEGHGVRAPGVGLKWPNDVLLDTKKVCGILLEASMDPTRIRWAIAGVGLNVNSEPLRMVEALKPDLAAEWQGRPRPVSLREHLGRATPRAPLLAALLARLTYWWDDLPRPGAVSDLLTEWQRRDVLRGRRVEMRTGLDRLEQVATGEAAGIGAEGQLLLRSKDGAVIEIFAGDVSVMM
jgi:BirA family biotin operon repressor/biotin-[acetyl-CoA-carboxylase] ligase